MLKEIIIPLGVGIAIFFFGLEIMRIGLNRIAGKKMEEWLSRFTKTPLLGFITGMIATSIVQSSSAITVITVGLVNARLLTYRQSIGIVLGSNVGTAVTVQLIALSLDDYVVPLIFIGLILWLIPKPTIRFTGLSIGGFSLLFIGLKVISTIAAPIANQPGFQAWFASMGENLMLSVLIGALFTAVIQSGTATIAIAMAFVEGGLIPLASSIAIVLGANLGTCFTAYLASLGGEKSGKLVAYAHIMLNLLGIILFLPFINLLTLATLYLSHDPSVQVAHAQTLFNFISSIVVLPFAHQFGMWVERIASLFQKKR